MKNIVSSEKLKIAIFGKTNSGKSSFFNAVLSQKMSIVSDEPGTTADPVRKSLEIPGIGPCVLVDTAGFDDLDGELGRKRVAMTRKTVDGTDIAIVLLTDCDELELEWISFLKNGNIPVIPVIGKCDIPGKERMITGTVERTAGRSPIFFSAVTGEGLSGVLEALKEVSVGIRNSGTLTGELAGPGDSVMLVMPQDNEAPEGRLILPQVRTIRELLDKGCTVVCCNENTMEASLGRLSSPPDLIITDSQVFAKVWKLKPGSSRLTSFSILFAAYKGDIGIFMDGTRRMSSLGSDSRVLIAEACSHVPTNEDIGRVKLPAMLKKYFGSGLSTDIVSGDDFPEDISSYDLVIHCGACMFGRKHVMSRISSVCRQGVPVTNYGLAIAWLTGILDKVDIPGFRKV